MLFSTRVITALMSSLGGVMSIAICSRVWVFCWTQGCKLTNMGKICLYIWIYLQCTWALIFHCLLIPTHVVLVAVAVAVVHCGHGRVFKACRQFERADTMGSWNLPDIPCSAGSKCCTLSNDDELLAINAGDFGAIYLLCDCFHCHISSLDGHIIICRMQYHHQQALSVCMTP